MLDKIKGLDIPWKAILLAPLFSAPASAVSGLGSSDAGIASDLDWGFFFGIILGVPASYLGTITIGLPAYLLLKKIDGLRLWVACAIGFTVPFAIFVNDAPLRTTLMAALSGFSVGAAAFLLRPK